MACLMVALLVLIFILLLRIFNRLTLKWCHCKTCLVGKTAIVTGGNSGLGFQTALGLASRGCKVIIADKINSDKTVEIIKEKTKNNLIYYKHLDLSSLKSVRDFAQFIKENEKKLHILINNAGTGAYREKFTADGLNRQMQINHFGPFLLTHLLLELLKKSQPSRIIFVSSCMAYVSNLKPHNLNQSKFLLDIFPGYSTYSNSKLANAITSKILAKKLKDTQITVNSLHPGAVQTNIFFDQHAKILHKFVGIIVYYGITKLFGKTIEEGCQTALHLAMCRRLEGVTGKFFIDCGEFIQPFKCNDEKLCNEIYSLSVRYVKLDDEKIK